MPEPEKVPGLRPEARISVCIPTTRPQTIGAAIRSVLRQRFTQWELLVIGQGDERAEAGLRQKVAEAAGRDQRVNYFHISPLGASRARNFGSANARGTLIAFIDDDCEADEGWLEVIVDAFSADPALGAVGGSLVAPRGVRGPVSTCTWVSPAEALHDPASSPARPRGWDWFGANVAVRATVAAEVGPWDELLGPGGVFPAAEDTDYKNRLEAMGVRMLSTPRSVVHHTSGTRTGRAALRSQRNYAFANGALAAKQTLSGDPRGRGWLEETRKRCISEWVRVRRPHRLPIDLRHEFWFELGYRRCLGGYEVDSSGLLRSLPGGGGGRHRGGRSPDRDGRAAPTTALGRAAAGVADRFGGGGPHQVRATVCIPTRDRGTGIVDTLTSLSRLDHPAFKVVVVDQSSDQNTCRAFDETVGQDPRFSYLPSATAGRSAACNVAREVAEGEFMAFTDDDCVVPADWLSGLERIFVDEPGVGLICAGVMAAEHSPEAGAIPTFTPDRATSSDSPWFRYRLGGIGANMALRCEAMRRIGPFDELLGAGAPLGAGEDWDLVYRALRARIRVLALPAPAVIHFGFRRWGTELRRLAVTSAMSEGAACMKHLRLGDLAILPSLLVTWFGRTVSWRNLLRFHGPVGLRRFLAFAHGLRSSFYYSVDVSTRTYRDHRPSRGEPFSALGPEAPVDNP